MQQRHERLKTILRPQVPLSYYQPHTSFASWVASRTFEFRCYLSRQDRRLVSVHTVKGGLMSLLNGLDCWLAASVASALIHESNENISLLPLLFLKNIPSHSLL